MTSAHSQPSQLFGTVEKGVDWPLEPPFGIDAIWQGIRTLILCFVVRVYPTSLQCRKLHLKCATAPHGWEQTMSLHTVKVDRRELLKN